MSDWHDYQEQASKAFTELGFEVTLDERIKGARATHAVDVAARGMRAGIRQLWVVECKRSKRKVTKAHVATLAKIVEDVGADRGILLCEAGFQPGARDVAENSNITLTSLADVRARAAEERAARGMRNAQMANALAEWEKLQALTDAPMPGPVRQELLSNIAPDDVKANNWVPFSTISEDIPTKYDDFIAKVKGILAECKSDVKETHYLANDYVILTPSGYMSSAHAERIRQAGSGSSLKYMMNALVYDP